ncbi:hypothetical protein NM208_g10633 [Fusarium decemcellulare]|uniref:Uncharacterized protein n=1 Tax=Fusarium decemcellulare TaxID=57161 RepID=A0ACC1RX72_9HYPO|nr:hypothetical protein NM208_g10633 [Fusarium decemcellulare]
MAEAAGLALSGIAFTSLVTSCVDILEYFNNGRYWIHDLGLALTKVSLLKVRLDQLEHTLHAGPFSNDTCHAALRGLSGVDAVLEQTNELCRRYSHLPPGGCEPITTTPDDQVCHTGQSHCKRHESLGLVMQRGERGSLRAWRRFDLEFLLSSIEKLVSSLQGGEADCSPPETRSPTPSSDQELQSSLHKPARVEEKCTIRVHHSQHMSSSYSVCPKDKSLHTKSQPQARPNMSVKRVTQSNMPTPETVDKFVRNTVEQAGLLYKGGVITPGGDVVTSGPVHAEENQVRGSVMVVGAQTSIDLDKVLNHLQKMATIQEKEVPSTKD